jgi:polysaccharide biosynthesis/export protein
MIQYNKFFKLRTKGFAILQDIKLVLPILLMGSFLLNSCIPQKKIKYVQEKLKNDTTESFYLNPRPKNKIQAFDNIYIKVISPDVITSSLLNSEIPGSSYQSVNYNMISYTVNDSGYITFPYVGLIYLKDLTILDARDTIQSALSDYISNATVIVKFVGKSVTVSGRGCKTRKVRDF